MIFELKSMLTNFFYFISILTFWFKFISMIFSSPKKKDYFQLILTSAGFVKATGYITEIGCATLGKGGFILKVIIPNWILHEETLKLLQTLFS